MTRTVLVLGTDHRFQRHSPDFPEVHHQQFAAYIAAAASNNGITALAEENSIAALAESNIPRSVIEEIACELGLKHRYCDPDMEVRGRLGIFQENQIRISAFPKQLCEVEVQRRLNESMRAREAYWLSELIKFNEWPVLFVCGANHSMPFIDLLRGNGFDYQLLAQDWMVS
jgi:hypothetical protein